MDELLHRCDAGHEQPIDHRRLAAFLDGHEINGLEGDFVPVSQELLSKAVVDCWGGQVDGRALARFLGHDDTLWNNAEDLAHPGSSHVSFRSR